MESSPTVVALSEVVVGCTLLVAEESEAFLTLPQLPAVLFVVAAFALRDVEQMLVRETFGDVMHRYNSPTMRRGTSERPLCIIGSRGDHLQGGAPGGA